MPKKWKLIAFVVWGIVTTWTIFGYSSPSNSWTETQGIVTKISSNDYVITGARPDSGKIYSIAYEYNVANHTYTSNFDDRKSIKSKTHAFAEGEKLNIWFNPQNPEQHQRYQGPGGVEGMLFLSFLIMEAGFFFWLIKV